MPSITTWSALGGLGKAAGQSLQEILTQRFAEQKQRDLLAQQEVEREEQRLEREALAAHRKTLETAADRSATSLEGTRSAQAAKDKADMDRAATEAADKAAALAELNSMTPEQWEALPQYRRYGLYNRAYGGGSPPAGALETPKEREARIKSERQAITDSQIAVERERERNRDPKEPSLITRQVPPAASALNTAIFNKYRDQGIQAIEDNFKHHVNEGHYDDMGDEIDLEKVHQALLMTFRRWKLAGGKEQNRLDRFLSGSGAPESPKPPEVPKTQIINGFQVDVIR